MSTTVTLLGLGHFAGVLGRLHAAALVAPEAPHRWCVLQGQPRRGGVARCGARRLLTRCRGAVRPLPCEWAALFHVTSTTRCPKSLVSRDGVAVEGEMPRTAKPGGVLRDAWGRAARLRAVSWLRRRRMTC